MSEESRVVLMDRAQESLRDHFLGWQCRLRQFAMRDRGGRPSEGMRPWVTPDGRGESLGRIVVLLNRQQPAEITAQFRHIYRRTQDPLLRLEDGMQILQGTFYQKSRSFADAITALFGPGSEAAARLVHLGKARLDFQEGRQSYRLPCRVGLLAETEPFWQATYWHNVLFNPNLPGKIEILAFLPDWAHARAEPPVETG
ncbi:MAG: hypothetical protein GDA41_11495 [Rhodospirillales bacterium]|nr:hypothetical protein [Rhodospirillales bacterium]